MVDESAKSDRHPPGAATFEFDGKSYKLPAVTIADKKAFHAWCNSQAIAEAAVTKPLIGIDGYTAEQYDEAYDRMLAKVGSGWWSPGSLGYREKLMVADGLSYMCWLCISRGQVEAKVPGTDRVTLQAVRDIVATQEGFDLLWTHFRLANVNPTDAPAE
jgi:hypothetical protein